jgi:PIN like domain
LGGIKVPTLLRAAGWDLVTMHEHYGRFRAQTVDDVTWITEMTAQGHALLTADARIVRNILEARAIQEAGAVVFILPKGDMTSAQMAERFDANRDGMDDRVNTVRPAAYAIYAHTISLVFP